MPEIELHSSAGRLRARHDPPEAEPPVHGPRAAVVCHPHPVQGGTMDNKVVVTVARALREQGLHVVRFNFRGAGGSEGEHDHGRGERDDVRAALDHAAELAGGGSLLMAGFSFGSWVGLSVAAEDERVTARLAVAPPVSFYDYAAVAADPTPLTLVYALEDELIPARAIEAWVAQCATPPRVVPVPGAGHLFHARLGPVRDAVTRMAARLAEAPS